MEGRVGGWSFTVQGSGNLNCGGGGRGTVLEIGRTPRYVMWGYTEKVRGGMCRD